MKMPSPFQRCVHGWPTVTASLLCTLTGCMPSRFAGKNASRPQPTSVTSPLHFVHNAGRVTVGESIRHVFAFRNPLSRRIRVVNRQQDLRTSCGCTHVQLADEQLEPQQTTAISVEVSTQGKQGMLLEQATVNWTSDDGEHHVTTFGVHANVNSIVVFSPPELIFTKEDVRRGTVKIVTCSTDALIDLETISLHTPDPYVRIVKREYLRGESRLRLEMSCEPTDQGGGRQTHVRAGQHPTRNRGWRWMGTLPVLSHDTSPLRAIPTRIRLRAESGDTHKLIGFVVLTGDSIEDGARVLDLETTRFEVSQSTEQIGNGALRVKIVAESDTIHTQMEKDHATLKVHMSDGQSIDIPFEIHNLSNE